MQNILAAMSAEARRLGHAHGESAAQWRARDPNAAQAFAAFVAANQAAITKALAAFVK